MTPLYIFDLDGTIALNDHRQHYLEDREDPRRWEKFFAACDKDTPNGPVIDTMCDLRNAGADVWVFSGRSDEVAEETYGWLRRHVPGVTANYQWFRLRMREAGDYTPDDVLKLKWHAEMSPEDRTRLVAVFDDRDKVVEMWRSAGVACFQVARGAF